MQLLAATAVKQQQQELPNGLIQVTSGESIQIPILQDDPNVVKIPVDNTDWTKYGFSQVKEVI